MNYPKPSIKVMLVDDHQLFRRGLAGLINSFPHYMVCMEASNGIELQKIIHPARLPDVIIMDINMPGMDGFKTMEWLKDHYPQIPVLALSMLNDEITIVRMLKLGIKGFLVKDAHPNELHDALNTLAKKGFFYNDFVTGKILTSLDKNDENNNAGASLSSLTGKEINFLCLCCTELAYREIAEQLSITPRAVEGYRERLFEKLDVTSRVGLVLFAIKNGLVKI
jgi:two-component system, NarL family, invasion response regulator UvrY